MPSIRREPIAAPVEPTTSGRPAEPHHRRWLLLIAVGLIATVFWPGAAASGQDSGQEPDLVVVTTVLEPFVERDGDTADGFYFEIWDQVASRLELRYEVVWTDSFDDMLGALADGTADIAVAPVAHSPEREQLYDFSAAVVSSGPQLGVHDRTSSAASLIRSVLGSGALKVLLVAMAGLVVLGHLIWLVERHDPEGFQDFHPSYLRGVWDGIWWATVTVSTVGYGDTAPRSKRGRAIAMASMMGSLFLLGAFVSQVTADVDQRRAEIGIRDLGDLDGRDVAAVGGSTFAAYLQAEDVSVLPFPSQAEVFQAAEDGTVDVVVANPFALAALGPDHGIVGIGPVLYEEFETFAMQQGSPWAEPINEALSEMQSSGRIQRIIDRWIN